MHTHKISYYFYLLPDFVMILNIFQQVQNLFICSIFVLALLNTKLLKEFFLPLLCTKFLNSDYYVLANQDVLIDLKKSNYHINIL